MDGAQLSVDSDRGRIEQTVLAILEDLTSDWDLEFSGGIGPDTQLIADLEFESIDVVQLIVSLEGHLKRTDLPFERLLMEDGRYVDDLKVSEIVDFLHKEIAA